MNALEVGLDRWVVLVFLAWTPAIVYQALGMTLEACVALAVLTMRPLFQQNRLFRTFSDNAAVLARHGSSLHSARCSP